MTVIEKLHLKGFKSFAKPTDLDFSNGFSMVIGPNGAGKSASYDTVVTLSNGKEIFLGDIVEKRLRESKEIKKLDDGVYCESQEDIEIISLNQFMKSESSMVSKFIKRNGEPHLYKIKTNSGKETKTTGCHSLIVFRDGKLQSSLVSDLKKDDLIATPRIIQTLSDKEDADLARLFGYILGDGYIRLNRIEFVNKDKEILEDYKQIIRNMFKIEPKYEKTTNGTTRLMYYKKEFISRIIGLIKNEKNK